MYKIMQFLRKNFIPVKNIVVAIMVVIIVCTTVVPVSATSWYDKTSDGYTTMYGSQDFTVSWIEREVSEPGFIESVLSGLLIGLGVALNTLLEAGTIKVSLNYLVYGRLANGLLAGSVQMDFLHFGMETNNPWGVMGSMVFYNLRTIMLSLLPIAIMISLITQLSDNGKKRAKTKEFLQFVVIYFLLLFALPYIIDLVIYIRDAVMYVSSKGITTMMTSLGMSKGESVTGSLTSLMYHCWKENKSFVTAAVYFASVCSILFYLADYIVAAGLLSIGFGLFPLILLFAFWNKKITTDWLNVMLPNLLFQFIDMILFMVPNVLIGVFVIVKGGASDSLLSVFTGSNEFVLSIIILIYIFCEKKIRNRIIELLGFRVLPGGAGLLAAAAMAMRMLSKKGSPASAASAATASAEEHMANSDEFGRRGEIMDAADRDIDRSQVDNRISDGNTDTDRYLNDMGDNAEPAESFDTGDLDTPEGTTDMGADAADSSTMSPDVAGSELGEVPGDDYGAGFNAEDVTEDAGDMPKDLADVSGEPTTAAESTGIGSDVVGRTESDVQPVSAPERADGEVPYSGSPDISNSDTTSGAGDNVPIREVSIPRGTVDSEVADTLSDRDKARYQNLADKDAVDEKIRENHQELESAGYNAGNYHKDRENLTRANESLDNRIHDIDNRINSSDTRQASERASLERNISSAESDRQILSDRNASLDSIIARNEAAMQGMSDTSPNYARLENENSKLRMERDSNQQKIDNLDNRIASSRGQIEHLPEKYEAERASLQERRASAVQDRETNQGKIDNLERLHRIDQDNQVLQKASNKYGYIESQFARNSGLGGMSTRSYANADDFKYQKQVENIIKQQADFKNFDTRRFEGVLSPQERQEFYRERAIERKREDAVNMARTAGAIAFGTIAAIGGAYGGPAGMLGGAMLGGITGGSASAAATRHAYNSADAGEQQTTPNDSSSRTSTPRTTSPDPAKKQIDEFAERGRKKVEEQARQRTAGDDAAKKQVNEFSERMKEKIENGKRE